MFQVIVLILCLRGLLAQEVPQSNNKKLIAKWNHEDNLAPSLELFWTLRYENTTSFIKIQEGPNSTQVYKNKTNNDYYYFNSSLFEPIHNYTYQIKTFSIDPSKYVLNVNDMSPPRIHKKLANIQNSSLMFQLPSKTFKSRKNSTLLVLISSEKQSTNDVIISRKKNFSMFEIALKCNETYTNDNNLMVNLETLLKTCKIIQKKYFTTNIFYVTYLFKSNFIDLIRYEVYEVTVYDKEHKVKLLYNNKPSWWLFGLIAASVVLLLSAAVFAGIIYWRMKLRKDEWNLANDAVANPLYS